MKKYRLPALLVLLVGCACFVLGINNVITAPEDARIMLGAVTLIIFLLFLYFWRTFFTGQTLQELYKGINLYEDECNPQAFIDYSRDAAEQFASRGAPYKVEDIWFLAYYTRALTDAGYLDEAAVRFNELRNDAAATRDALQQAAKIINIEPLIRKLLGGQYALQALEEVRALYQEHAANPSPREAFYLWELRCLEKQRDGDLRGLGEEMRQASNNDRNSWYVRVECAEREAWVQRAMGHLDEERERLEFVVRHGNVLPHVQRARQRLAELSAQEARLRELPPQGISAV